MKTIIRITLFITLLSIISFADEYAVISNNKMKDLSTAQIKAIFLKKITVVNNIKVIPVNLGARDPLREKFEKKVIKIKFSRLKSYWTKHHYLGHRPPISMKSEASVKAFVQKVDGAIGYINASNVDDSVKVIYRWSE